MRGSISLPVNMIGYIVVLAIFIGIMVIIASFWFNFQTIPTETPEKATASDLAYMLSMWKNLTVYPNIFNKTLLEEWKTRDGMNKTANSIFENMSEFFLPRSDFFIHIYGDEPEPYSLYVPPESKSAFEGCAQPTGVSDLAILVGGAPILALVNPLGFFYLLGNYKDFEKIVTYNKISVDSGEILTFIADGQDIKIGTMVAGLTTNLATQLRGGIYEVGVKGRESIPYDLGIYPQGCIVNEGGYKIEEKIKIKKEGGIFDIWGIGWIVGKIYDAFAYVTNVKTYAICGFNWEWNNTTNVLKVIPASGEKDCPLKTRIPKKIVNESNLSAKICKPRKVWGLVWWPYGIDIPGYKEGRKHFYLRLENIKPEGDWSKEKQLEYCKRECQENPPYLGGEGICEDYCVKYNENPDKLNDNNYCYNEGLESYDIIRACKTARDHYLLYERLPFDAIDIKYIIVDENKLSEGKSLSDLNRDEYREGSACAGWPGVFECDYAKQCSGVPCVGHKCSSCNNSDNLYEACSPDYLENPASVGKEYMCQRVLNQSWPSREEMFECLPTIRVNKSFKGTEINEIDCSQSGYENAEVTWIINASEICCDPNGWITADEEITKEDGSKEIIKVKKCKIPLSTCPKMKLWPNINSSNVHILAPFGEEGYTITIKQKVCRNGYPYNNADKAFIVANYPVVGKDLKYSLMDSEIELKGPTSVKIGDCECVGTYGSLSDGHCEAKVSRVCSSYTTPICSDKLIVKKYYVKYDSTQCFPTARRGDIDEITKGNTKTYCSGNCTITNTDDPSGCGGGWKKACLTDIS